ncbi:unnamed protein product [Closterium sp. NIES-53]
MVGVVEPVVSLLPEAWEDFKAVAAAVQANPMVLQDDVDGKLLVLSAGKVLGRARYTCRVLCTELRPCTAELSSKSIEVVAMWTMLPQRKERRFAGVREVAAGGSAAAARARVARVVAKAEGVVVVEAVEAVEVAEVAVGVVAGVGALVAAVVAAVGVVVAMVAAVGVVAAAVVAVGVELFRGEVLAVAKGSSSSVGARPLRLSSFAGVDIFALDYDAILAAMYALVVSAEGDCYLCVLPNPGIEAAALGASESALPGTATAKALHTFTLDSGASCCFFRDSTTLTPLPAPVLVSLADPSGGPVLARSSTVLPCLAVSSDSLSGLDLLSFSTNLVR